MNPYYLNRKLRFALRHMRRAAAVSTAGLFLLASCAPGSGLPPLPRTTTNAYRLGAGERVRVIIFGQQQLTGEFRINDNGTISVPLLGAIPALRICSEERCGVAQGAMEWERNAA